MTKRLNGLVDIEKVGGRGHSYPSKRPSTIANNDCYFGHSYQIPLQSIITLSVLKFIHKNLSFLKF